MNAIHQISLKLQLGIDPAAKVAPSALRAMWQDRSLRNRGARTPPRDATGRSIQPAQRRP